MQQGVELSVDKGGEALVERPTIVPFKKRCVSVLET